MVQFQCCNWSDFQTELEEDVESLLYSDNSEKQNILC